MSSVLAQLALFTAAYLIAWSMALFYGVLTNYGDPDKRRRRLATAIGLMFIGIAVLAARAVVS